MSTVTPNDSNTLVTVKIEGQEIKLAAAIANNDDLLRRVLAPVYPGAANSTITRTADGKSVDVIKKAGTKGGGASTDIVISMLDAAPEAAGNPVVELYRQYVGIDMTTMSAEQLTAFTTEAQEALEQGESDEHELTTITARLDKRSPIPAPFVVVGF